MKNRILYRPLDVAIVTLFNPEDSVVDNIKSYLPYVKELLIVDNSKKPYDLTSLKKEISQITVLSTSKNLGVSKALNLAIRYAKKKEYKWLLTMDQDTYFDSSEIRKFIASFNQISHKDLAIFSPLHNSKFLKEGETYNSTENCVMTSANIISVDKSLAIGGFDENLFIDEVDHDFCLRLRERGYKVVQNYNCFVHHTLGERCSVSKVNLYSCKRLYYMVRNYLYIRGKHKKTAPQFFKKRDRYLLKFMTKQVIYTQKRKEYLKMAFAGTRDYYNNRMGYRVAM